ncbi:AraC family transcriptional regulator [Salipiger sp. H15]|uniref:AraC family transcriptional regulator n=1 Tax=Alloyangia sp. H15 TaxID=3029062 RepID=A0AAU8AFB4_9RHOB
MSPPAGAEDRGIRLVSPGQQPGWSYGLLHDRAEVTLLWLTRGQGRITLDGRRRGLGAHNAVFIPARTLFALDLGPQSLGLVLHAPPGAGAAFPAAPLHLRVREALVQAELTALFEAMQRELARGRAFMDEALDAHLRLMAVWLLRQQQEGLGDQPGESAAQRLSQAYAAAVVAGFRGPDGPGEMAARLGVSGPHLTRACRAACGRSAQRILSERKLHEARRLLAAEQEPVAGIAEALGFSSPAYFTRFIRKQTGQAPSELRGAGARPGARLSPRRH